MKTYKVYKSLFQAVNPHTGRLKVYRGMNIIARTMQEAQRICNQVGLDFLVIDDVCESEFFICLN